MSIILILRGTYLIAGFTMLESAYTLYKPLAGIMWLWAYGWVCLIAGIVQSIVVLWPSRPLFEWRLFARMGVCFCFVVFSLNLIDYVPPPIGAITHLVLSGLSIWSVLRTSHNGG